MDKLPSIFVSHGSPTLLIDEVPARDFLRALPGRIPRPKAIIAVSAHNIARTVTVGMAHAYRQVADFGGFPEELYRLSYRPPGDPHLGERVARGLTAAGIETGRTTSDGIDHGSWVPLSLMYPLADVPVVPVSLQAGLDGREHLAIGAALGKVARETGALLLASGSITHNLGEFGRFGLHDPPPDYVAAFADRVAEWLLHGETDELLRWQELAPQAVRNHPSTEHFIPLFVALGAGEGGAVTALHRSYAFGMLAMDAYAFG